MRAWSVAVTALFLLAGCADEAPVDDASEGGALAPHAADSRVPGATGAVARPGGGANESFVVDIAEEGYVPAGAYYTLGWAFLSAGERWFPQEIDGRVQDVRLTMEWSAENPTTESLLLAFGEMEVDEDGHEYAEVYETVRGTSPLTLELDALGWEGDEFVVWAWIDGRQPVVASLDQAFTITGTVVAEA